MSIIKSKEEAIRYLTEFINEMEHTLQEDGKLNKGYAPQVYWKNSFTLSQIVEWLKEN